MFKISLALIISIVSFVLALVALFYARFYSRKIKRVIEHVKADRHIHNPILSPYPYRDWEQGGTFNPATVSDDMGNVHMLYRAVGADGVSRIGYAVSQDGLHFDRVHYPVFALRDPRNNIPEDQKRPNPAIFPSGGSWGGAEDPRVVRIDNRVYMTFNAFDGWDFIRIGIVSMKDSDFFENKWNWSKPLFLSPKGQVHKNWILFPEKINGKFAILHSITPEIQIDYVERLEDLDRGYKTIKSKFSQKPSKDRWDSFVRGAGPPPIKTPYGWLIFYHGMDKKQAHIGYKLGVMLLDPKDPAKLIARSPEPILTPDMWYENDWKPGVVYACGTAVKDGKLYVYYGGGDKHVCVANTDLDKLLKWLLQHGKVS